MKKIRKKEGEEKPEKDRNAENRDKIEMQSHRENYFSDE